MLPCPLQIPYDGIADHIKYTYDKLKLPIRQHPFMVCDVLDI